MKKFNFIDLYAGIGGIRFGFEYAGGKCVFSSEWDKYSQITYEAFHGEKPNGNIHDIDIDDIPDHDILTAGFPCQPFSLAGVSKKNSLGKLHGFDDPTQGTEFFKVKEILKNKKPKAFLLENVKNLKSHDKGNTYRIIEKELKKIGYTFESKIIDAANWVPQHRERIYIVGYRNDIYKDGSLNEVFKRLQPKKLYDLADVIIDELLVNKKYTIGEGTWNTLLKHKKNHALKGNGFGYSLIESPYDGKTTRTISARYGKDGAEILIKQSGDKRPRRITPLEACKLQGFPQKCYKYYNGTIDQPISDTQAYKQFGNSVAVPVIKAIAKSIVITLNNLTHEQKSESSIKMHIQ